MNSEIQAHTSSIVAAYVSNNSIETRDIPNLIQIIGGALLSADQPVPEPQTEFVPAVNPKKSVFPDYVVCLEDGKQLKMLKRHLMTSYGLTPDEYRKKWSLPSDYPMTAPRYSAIRSGLAKEAGLGLRTSSKPARKKASLRVAS
jgi:MucR family transcriptional regulator, transcriptional regulator of exopolysaccharide biosynthesis